MKNNLDLDFIKKTKRFEFIIDSSLKEELYLFLYYITFLYKEINETKLFCEHIIFSKKHTIIIYVLSIIEAILYYFVSTSIYRDKIKLEKYCKIYSYKELKDDIRIIKWEKEYIICEKLEKDESFKEDINFNFLIKWVEKHWLLSKKVIKILTNIRKKRNSVHLKVLQNSKLDINFNDLEQLFNEASFVIDEISKKINNNQK